MATQVVMPKLSPTMEEGQLSRWLKKEGEKVGVGEPLAEIDTDKATMEAQALATGVLRKILVPEGEDFLVPLGVADVKREGADCTVVARSMTVPLALKAAEELEKQGVSVEVIDPRTIRPLDIETIINSVKKTNRVVVAEESHAFAGVGAELSAQIMEQAFDYLDAPVKRLSGADAPMPYAKNLERLALPDVEKIVKAVREVAYLD